MYLHDFGHSSTNPNDTIISAANATNLTLSWTSQITNVPPIGSVIADSVEVVGNTAYVGAWDGNFSALNATNGHPIWRTYLGQTNATNAPKCKNVPRGITSSSEIFDGVVYVSGGGNYTYALNATTGQILWKVFVGDNSNGNYNWASPVIYHGYEYLGVASDCDEPLVRGELMQIDLATHTVVHTFYTVPTGKLGGTIWTTPTFDPAQNEIIIATGNCDMDVYSESPYCEGIIALHLDNISEGSCAATCDESEVAGHWQDTSCSGPISDCDLPTSPALFQKTDATEMVEAGDKNGTMWAFDADDIDAGPVWHRQIAHGGDIEKARGLAATAVFTGKYLVDAGQEEKLGSTTYNGTIAALNPDTGAISWQTGLPDHQSTWGAVTYENGVIIEGAGALAPTYNGTVFVLNASTGAIMWDYPTPGLFYGPATVALGHIFIGDYLGTVYSFGVSGSLDISSFTASPATITLGGSSTFTTDAVRGSGVYSYLYTGLPSGCTTANTSSLVCTPTQAGSFNVAVKVTDTLGASKTAHTTLTVNPVYAVTFSETGLPSGTSWSVTLNGSLKNSTTTTIVFAEPNGSYPFSLSSIAGYHPSPPSGTATVAGAPVPEPISWTRAEYAVTFSETGLPSGTSWTVVLNGSSNSSTTSAIVFNEPNGTFPYTISPVPGYSTSTYSGSVPVAGHAAGVTVPWTRSGYAVTFEESGLVAGTEWSVTLNGSLQNSSGTSIGFSEPNGSYLFTVGQVAGYSLSSSSGSVNVTGAAVTEPITFTPILYNVTFSESNLPTGTAWSVKLNGVVHTSTNTQVRFQEENGTYPFTIAAVSGYQPSPSGGTAVVQGADLLETVHFSVATLYTIFVQETGLPGGTAWSITVNGTLVSATGSVASTMVPNGTYSVEVNGVLGYRSSVSSFEPTVAGHDVTLNTSFSVISYSVFFVELGLPQGQLWSITLGIASHNSSTTTVVFSVSNGSFTYTVGVVVGYTSSPSGGNLSVSGKNVTEQIQFNSTSAGAGANGGLSALDYGLIGVLVALAVAGLLLALYVRRKPQKPVAENP